MTQRTMTPSTFSDSSNPVDLSGLSTDWPLPFVRRREVLKFSHGIVYPGTLANADCVGAGPRNAFRLGRNICYPVQDLLAWLEGRAKPRKVE